MHSLADSAYSVFHALVALSWKGALLALITGALLLLLRRKMSPAWRHALWMLVFLRLTIPDVGVSRWAVSGWMPKPQITSAVVAVAPVLASPSEPLASEPSDESPARADAEPVARSLETVAATPSVPMAVPWTLEQKLTAVWLLGVVSVFGLMMGLHLRMTARLRRDRRAPSDEALNVLRQCCTAARVSPVPTLIMTDAVTAPALFGVLRPAILMPSDLVADAASLRLILLHELAHLKRRDLWVQVVTSFVVALHWFNPLAWWAHRRLRAEAEMAADAHVLRLTEKAEAHRFGEVLLGFASRAAAGWALWFAAATVLGIAEGRHDLRRRIDAIVDFSRGRRAWWIVGLTAFVMLAVTGMTQAPAEETKKNSQLTASLVSGVVVDQDGKPIEGAMVTLSDFRSRPLSILRFTTKADGLFRFENVPETGGELSLGVRRQDYMDPKPLFTKLLAQKRDDIRLTLTKAEGWVTGTVTDKTDGKPVKGAKVWLEREPLSLLNLALSRRDKQQTDEAGRFRLQPTIGTSGILVIDAPGMALTTRPFNWKGGELLLSVAIQTDSRMTGHVVNADRKPVADAVLCLCNSLMVPDLKDRPSKFGANGEFSRIGVACWPGEALTKADGTFDGRSIDSEAASLLWMFAIHPTEGISWVRVSDWKLGGTIKLERWNVLEGTVVDQNGKPVSKATGEFYANVRLMGDDDQYEAPVSRLSKFVTDENGHYRVEQMLPHSRSGFIRINGEMVLNREITVGSGETRPFDIHLRPLPAELRPKVPKEQMRRVAARIVTPEGFKPVSDDYEIRMNVELAGARRWVSVTPDAEGRVETEPVAPGQYLLHAWVNSKGRKLVSQSRGASMRFKLDLDPAHPVLDVGDIKLGPENFRFQPNNNGAARTKSTPRTRQVVNAKIASGGPFVTWAGSSGGEWSAEYPVADDGKLMGSSPVNASGCFILRGTKADGSRWFTGAQMGKADANEPFDEAASFSAAATLEGRITGLPSGYAGDGWIAAADEVYVETSLGHVVEGHLPLMTWCAWSPVKSDGTFKFSALPRGGMFLMGFGPGWTTSSATGSQTLYHINLTEPGSEQKVEIESKSTIEKAVRVLLPDGSAAAKAKITVTSLGSTWWDRPLGRSAHDADPQDAEAYRIFLKTRNPGHRATTDSEGKATLSNLPDERLATISCQVEWTKSGIPVREKINIKPTNSPDHEIVVKLTGQER